MKVLVCGGRKYNNWERVREVLDIVHGEGFIHQEPGRITVIVHGGATGADTFADRWARLRVVENRAYPAKWGTHGPSAGPIRNQTMLDIEKPDLVIAFPGGTGTADMRRRAVVSGTLVLSVDA